MTSALVFEDAQFVSYSPQSVCLPGSRDFEPGEDLRLEDENQVPVGTATVEAVCTAPLDRLPASWIGRYHLPRVKSRYGLTDELDEQWDGVDTKTICTLVLMDMDLNENAQSA